MLTSYSIPLSLFFTKSVVLREVQRQSYDQLSTEWQNLDPETLCSMINDNQVPIQYNLSSFLLRLPSPYLQPFNYLPPPTPTNLVCLSVISRHFLIVIWLHLETYYFVFRYHIISYHIISSHTISCRTKDFYLMPCSRTSYDNIPYYIIFHPFDNPSLKPLIVSGCFSQYI